MNLVIVESPTKARKLKGYLGSDFIVEASVGHVRDLPESGLGVDVDNGFEPQYEVNQDKKKVLSVLESAAAKASKVYLATDPDREGEAIAWHVKYLLQNSKKNQLQESDFLRATFHEITKSAVLDAVSHPEELKLHLVDAQQARRVVDRLVGYKISPVLWKKIRRGLSAGRVQSVALRLIVEREREIEAFIPEEYWEVDVALDINLQAPKQVCFKDGKPTEPPTEGVLIARVIEVNGKKFEPTSDADVLPLRSVLPAASYQVKSVETSERNRVSLPPFTTSTLQQKAATMLGMSSKQTMRLAQDLYEEGLITYHRTDSVSLSASALDMARAFISAQYGDKYLPAKPRNFVNKSKNAQEAHEAIRVTDVSMDSASISSVSSRFTDRHAALYNLIWRRFLASQMETAVYDQTSIVVQFTGSDSGSSTSGLVRTSGSVLRFDGWTRLFPNSEDVVLPSVKTNQTLLYADQNFAQKFTQPPARFNDASLVKTLEKMGIGRPSTYASIISVIIDRGYVERTDRKFFATSIGMTVSDFLVLHFPTVLDYEFTAEMEEDLDRIARGEKEWRSVVGAFYKPFELKLKAVDKDAERVSIPVEKTGETCPDCGNTEHGEIVIRSGRFGKFRSCSRYPECKYTQNIVQTVPDVVCPLCQKGEVLIKSTRWGKSFFGCSTYPICGWASWIKPQPGEVMTPAEWQEQQAKREARKAARAEKYGPRPDAAAAKKKPKKAVAKKKVATKKPSSKTTAKASRAKKTS